MIKLTQAQSDMVAENEKLIYWYIHANSLPLEEYYDLLAIELCYAVFYLDEERSKLSTYFKLRADNRMYKEFTKRNAKKRKHVSIPLNDIVHYDKYEDDFTEEFVMEDWINSDDTKILKLKSVGYNQSEIADMIGYSQTYVSKKLKEFKKDYDR